MKTKLKQDLFATLPSEIMLDILLRLPFRSIMTCKCVCKSFRSLIKTHEFVESHFPRSIPCLALFQSKRISKPYKIMEFVDSTHNSDGQNLCSVSSNFSLPCHGIVHSSASGLLFLSSITAPDDLFLCNPLTRECLKLPPCPTIETYRDVAYELKHNLKAFGFGVSKLTGRYKVVKIFYARWLYPQATAGKCEVYTLGTKRWRRVSTGGKLWYAEPMSLAFSLNGNLHWLVQDPRTYPKRILCFHLETECFSTFVPPEDHDFRSGSICALRGCLCCCKTSPNGFDVWLMNKYGDDKSWTKDFVIKKQHSFELSGVNVPIKVFLDGDLLFVNQFSSKLYCYSSKTNAIREIRGAESLVKDGARPTDYTPSFLPLITYMIGNVSSSRFSSARF